MKLIILFLVASFGFAQANVEYQVVPTERVYTPKGFDSNDNAEVIVSGFLPNLCFQNPRHKITRNGKDIFITINASRIKEEYCPEVVVPFLEVVDIGMLEPKKYNIYVNDQTQTPLEESIEIVQRTNGRIDEAIYPIVFNVKYERSNNSILIEAYKPSDCYEFDKVEFYSDKKNLITVLPKMRKIRDFCPMKLTPLTIREQLPNLVNSLKTLIHVRSLNQESKNIEVIQ